MANPALPPDKKQRLTRKLMQARRKKGTAMRVGYNVTRGEWVAPVRPGDGGFWGAWRAMVAGPQRRCAPAHAQSSPHPDWLALIRSDAI